MPSLKYSIGLILGILIVNGNFVSSHNNPFRCKTCVGDECKNATIKECGSSRVDQCYWLFDENMSIVKLGCRSEFEENDLVAQIKDKKLVLCDVDECNTLNSFNNVVTCSEEGCNNLRVPDLFVTSIGDPGKWQKLPLACYTCQGQECLESDGVLERCLLNDSQTCTTVFNSDDQIISRGCSNAVLASHGTYCNANPGDCFDCKSNGCNTAESKNDYVDCIFCDGQNNTACTTSVSAISSTRKCHKACMTALYPRTLDADASYELTRTCLDDKEFYDHESCDSNSLCQSCTESSCNNAAIPKVRTSCYQCSGDSCELPTAVTCNSYTKNEQCYTLFDDKMSVAEKGCKSYYDPAVWRSLLIAKRLLICDGNNCNDVVSIPQQQNCRLCSSRTDPSCATIPSALASSTTCNGSPITECYTRVLADGHTERGCLSSLEDDQFLTCFHKDSASCNTCGSNLCNDKVFPADRISCNTCESDKNLECEATPWSDNYCLTYSPDQKCVTALNNDITQRGCSSELTCDEDETSICRTCQTNNCNVINLKRNVDVNPGVWQALPLNCYTCADEGCEVNRFSTRMSFCEGNKNQHCMTVFEGDSTVVRRGCSDDVEAEYGAYCERNTTMCPNCNSNGCNTASSKKDYIDCIYCDTSVDKNCVTNVDAVLTRRRCHKACMVALRPRIGEPSIYELSRSCLDDKDLDDREECGSDGSHCKTCTTAQCNKEDVIPDRMECYKCVGGNCENASSQKCSSHMLDDTCFMLFDNSSNVQQMGCTSELNADEREAYQYQVFTCSGKNCNSYSNIPKPKSCAACDSSVDDRCASNPTEVETDVQCSSLPLTDCSTRVRSDGSTVRGCLSDLQEPIACLTGDDPTCTSCKGDRCNVGIFPQDRLQCFQCNSISNTKCQDAPTAAQACSVYDNSQVCSSKLENDVTYRGCSHQFLCDDSDKQLCRVCNGSNCNTINLYRDYIGEPGIFQGLPINCLTCSGIECDEPSTTLLQKCENNNQQKCATVFSIDGKVIQRGCNDEIYEGENNDHCYNNPELCPFCKSSACNDADSLDTFVNCLFCDSSTDLKCTNQLTDLSKTRKCQKQCMTSFFQRSTDANPAYGLLRSCLDDKDLDDRDECASGNSKYCKSCEGERCNTDVMPNDRLSCFRCLGEDCEESFEFMCPYFRENDRCITLFDQDSTNVAQQGCASDFENSALTALYKQLLYCDGDNCNSFNNMPVAQNCLVCDSASDPRCATNPDLLISFKQCTSFPYSSCFSRIDSQGFTKRGCLSDNEADTIQECIGKGDDVNCNLCTGEYCNIEVYPANRRSCHQCSSENDNDCHTSPKDTSLCALHQDNQECVVALSGETTKRGCASNLMCKPFDRQTCRICESDDCNSVDLISNYVGSQGVWQVLPLKCYECEGDGCKSSLGEGILCKDNDIQNCMTVFDSSGAVVKRGCSDDIAKTHEAYCDENIGSCQSCKSSNCNNAESLNDYVDCVFCDTNTNPNCVLNLIDVLGTRKCHNQCMIALYPKLTDSNTVFELSRSCLDDKESEDRDKCLGGTDEHCQACSGEKCNNYAFPTTRKECLKCTDDDCEDAEPQECVFYDPADQCYILFDDENSIEGMGCSSEYSRAQLTEMVKKRNILLCGEKNNCNTFDSVPNTQACIVCNSATDPTCATNPNLVSNVNTCSTLPYTGCFTRIIAGGHTQRGCQSQLSDSVFYDCQNASDPACSMCKGDRCNAEIFPSDRLKCQRCNSADDAKCATSPDSNSVCPKVTDGDSCVVAYKGDVTARDCSSELSCDVSDRKRCRVCEGSGCNTNNLEIIAGDGEPGRWQVPPIKCHTCIGDTCGNSLGSVQLCDNKNLQNCMTVFNSDGVVIQRGCSDSVIDTQENFCDNNPDKCYGCNSNECNLATSPNDYIECVSCDTELGGACVLSPLSISKTRKCYKSCMVALFPRLGESDPAYDTSRSCLDDKDLSDSETCQTGLEAICKACDTDKCNIDNFPTDRRSCFHCSGDGCQLPTKEFCVGYRANDQCFFMFDERQKLVKTGCRSEFTIAQSDELVLAKRLLLCNGDDCNNLNALPQSHSCVLCNSRTDVNCAVEPSAVTSTTICGGIYTDCCTRVLNDGATERGCLSNLAGNDFNDCLTGNSTTCTTCAGPDCNNQLYPPNRMSCHVCDSSTNPNCEGNPNSLSVCAKLDANETCVTSLNDGTTFRGCGSDLQCDTSNRKNCRVCSYTGCNTVNLEAKQDNNFGKWQDLPLSCFECSGANCQGEPSESTKCEENNDQDCSTVFNAEGSVIRRGCSDQVDIAFGDYCDANPGHCFNCKSNKCNIANALSDFKNCVACDSFNDKTCVTEPTSGSLRRRQCQGGCMVALYPSDSSFNASYELIRTCTNDKELTDQAKCSAGSDDFCKHCTDAECNTYDLPENRLRCYTCLGESCENPISEKCLLHQEDDQCFVRFDSSNSVAEMGCLSDFRNQQIIDIIKTKRVYLCEGAECNALDKIPTQKQCAACDSETDVQCAIRPGNVATVSTCALLPYTNCYSKISKDGTTTRGCLSDLDTDEFAVCLLSEDANCAHCVGDGCNREIFPEDRLQCHTCSSEIDNDCESLPTTTAPCPAIGENCVSALSGNITDRGCSSQVLCDIHDKSTCRHCSFTGCNTLDLINRVDDGNHGLWQPLPLRCHTCSGMQCLVSLGPALNCTNGDQQDCMTVFAEDGEVIHRGCQYDVEDVNDLYCRANPDRCQICKSNECNDAWQLSDYVDCVYCNSETDPTCVSNPQRPGLPTRKCQKGCMAAALTASNGTTEIVRSCLDDKEIEAQYLCSEDKTGMDCSSCSTSSCNTFNYPRDRLTCHVCQGADCTNTVAQYCAPYTSGDTCFAKYENGKVEYSGCTSAVDSNIIESWRQENKVFICEGDSCNSPDKLPVPQTCVTCTSSQNVECATNPSSVTSSQLCAGPITSCFSNIEVGVTQRGCLQSLSYSQQIACQESEGVSLCTVCSGEKCNSAIHPTGRRRCHICNSEQNDKCKGEPEAVSICPTYLANDQCVVKFTTSPSPLTERGCSSDLQCDASDSNNCNICNTDACNTMQLDNGAFSMIANNLLLTMLLAVVSIIALNSCWF